MAQQRVVAGRSPSGRRRMGLIGVRGVGNAQPGGGTVENASPGCIKGTALSGVRAGPNRRGRQLQAMRV